MDGGRRWVKNDEVFSNKGLKRSRPYGYLLTNIGRAHPFIIIFFVKT
tara:strand:- start:585 stop:725 length:141 start_codon:yes stop_codon:yes gene_type:complete